MGIGQRQFAFHVLAAALIAVHGSVGFVEGAQDFGFGFTVQAGVFVDGHKVFLV